jgi:hypothetical protein
MAQITNAAAKMANGSQALDGFIIVNDTDWSPQREQGFFRFPLLALRAPIRGHKVLVIGIW